MIRKICEKGKLFLPLKIEVISWNDPELLLYGERWSFNTLSSWRIVNNGRLLCGCYDESSKEIIEQLTDLSIVTIDPQTIDLPIDLAFGISNGYKLEIFSTSYYEPWTLGLPNEPLYVACPSDPRYVN